MRMMLTFPMRKRKERRRSSLDLSNLKYPIYYDIENFDSWEDDNGDIRRPPTSVSGYEQIITTISME